MNEICEMWSVPWHALQRNLALGLAANAASLSAPALKSSSVQGVAVSANSWLSRARRQAAAPPQVRL